MFKYNLSHLSRVSRVHLIRKCLFEIVALSIQPILALLLGFARMHMRRLVCFVRVEKESPTENLENCRHTFPTIIQKQDAASGLCAMPSRNIPILHAMRQARRFRSLRTSSAPSCLNPLARIIHDSLSPNRAARSPPGRSRITSRLVGATNPRLQQKCS